MEVINFGSSLSEFSTLLCKRIAAIIHFWNEFSNCSRLAIHCMCSDREFDSWFEQNKFLLHIFKERLGSVHKIRMQFFETFDPLPLRNAKTVQIPKVCNKSQTPSPLMRTYFVHAPLIGRRFKHNFNYGGKRIWDFKSCWIFTNRNFFSYC